jgi:PAS domain S-box-containing protein
MGIRALAAVPLIQSGKLVLTLNAASTLPHIWTEEEVALIQVVAERTWDAIERAHAEVALRVSEERLRCAVTVATVGVLFFDLHGRITDANEALERMTGYSREELCTQVHWEVCTPPEFREVTAGAARQLAMCGRTAPYEKQQIRKDGSRWWGLFAPTRLTGTGPDSECVEFIIDITAVKQAAEALQLADRRKDEFLATLGHELRNPLAPLRNGLQIARLTSDPGTPFRRALDMMERQLSHLVHLVNDLLDVGRITSGKIQLNFGRVALEDVLATSAQACRSYIDAHGHQLIIEAAAKGLIVNGDFDRLTQVFSNLLTNAAKYTEGRGQIRVRITREADDAVISVVDTGIGIPEPDLPHVFDLFSQVRVHQHRTEGGLGIGLSIVLKLVESHRGTVSVSSAGPGRGSTFTVRLPLMRDGAEVAPRPEAQELMHGAGARRRILVVDDNEDAAESLAMLLEQLGHVLAIAHDGQEGVEKARSFRPDVVFLDLGMPRMDGFEAARQLRSLPEGRELLLVALTGWGQEKDQARTRAAGFDWHLLKPLEVDALRNIMSGEPASPGHQRH